MRLELRLDTVELPDVIQQAMDMIQPSIQMAQQTLTLECPPD